MIESVESSTHSLSFRKLATTNNQTIIIHVKYCRKIRRNVLSSCYLPSQQEADSADGEKKIQLKHDTKKLVLWLKTENS